jgi:hypothetical protein
MVLRVAAAFVKSVAVKVDVRGLLAVVVLVVVVLAE